MGKDVRESEEKQEEEATYKTHWPTFLKLMESRLDQGHLEYEDRSFSRDPKELLKEIEEEILDMVGWPFILWVRVRKMLEALENVDAA